MTEVEAKSPGKKTNDLKASRAARKNEGNQDGGDGFNSSNSVLPKSGANTGMQSPRDALNINGNGKKYEDQVIHRSDAGILMTGLNSEFVKPTMAENEFMADGRLPFKPYGGPF